MSVKMQTQLRRMLVNPNQANARTALRADAPGNPASDACLPRIWIVMHMTICQKREKREMLK